MQKLPQGNPLWKIDETVVRISGSGDAESLAELYRKAFPTYPYTKVFDADWHAEGNPYTIRIMAEKEGVVVGAAALDINPPCLLGEIKQEAVLPEYRKNGLCRDMTGVLTEIAESIGLEKVYLEARTRAPGMQKAV